MRRRISLLAAATALVAVALMAIPLAVIARRGYVKDELLELQRAAAAAAASVRGDRLVPVTRVDSDEIAVSMYGSDGRLLSGAGAPVAPRIVRKALHGNDDAETGTNSIAVSAGVSDGDRTIAAVLVRSDLSEAYRRSWHATLVLCAMGVVAVALAALGARALATRLAAPVDRLKDTARKIGGGDLSARAELSGVAEFDTLAVALNEGAQQIQTMVERERRFSTEVSHQLRTPLSELRLALEVGDSDRAELAVDRLETTIADVISLARDLPQQRDVPLSTVLADLEHRWHGRLAMAARPLRVSSAYEAETTIGISAAAAGQVLDVLVENACVHGAGAVHVTVRELENTVAVDVSDEGTGPASEPHELFVRRDDGTAHGIGLQFARRLAEAEQARVVLTRAAPPTFSLVARRAEPPTPDQSRRANR